jgi:hypothetical protein
MAVCCFLVVLLALTPPASGAGPVTPGYDNPIGRVETVLNQDFSGQIEANFARIKIPDYLVGSLVKAGHGIMPFRNPKLAKCFPAAGKAVCGAVDERHGILAFSHYGCCLSDTVMTYSDPASLGLPDVDLSSIRTHRGLALGSTAAEVSAVLGTPKVFHGVRSGRTAYGYVSFPEGVSHCPVSSIFFVFDRERRVSLIQDGFGC